MLVGDWTNYDQQSVSSENSRKNSLKLKKEKNLIKLDSATKTWYLLLRTFGMEFLKKRVGIKPKFNTLLIFSNLLQY